MTKFWAAWDSGAVMTKTGFRKTGLRKGFLKRGFHMGLKAGVAEGNNHGTPHAHGHDRRLPLPLFLTFKFGIRSELCVCRHSICGARPGIEPNT